MKNPLKVSLLSISPHNRAILEFFFAGAGKQIFATVSIEQADAFIVDFDHPGARQEWQDQIAISVKPAIVLSVKETEEENTVWVPKPLTSKALLGAAETIKPLMPQPEKMATSSQHVAAPEPSAISEQNDAQANDAKEEEHRRNMASLRALLNQQTKDAQPFGVSKQNIRKAPPISPPVRSATADSLVRTAFDESVGAQETVEAKVSSDSSADDEHHLGTEDVYVPPPLADEDVPEADSSSAFQLDGTPDDEDPIRLEQRWNRLCGQEQDIVAANWQESSSLYTPENYLLNRLVDALKLSHQSKQYVQLKIDTNDYILLMPDVNLVYCSIEPDSDEFAELCDTPLKTGRVELHLPSTNELVLLEEAVQRDAHHTYDMESLIWTASLLTSRGRLNRNADFNQPLRLKHWPNLTRLEQFPHTMQIAAVWHQRVGNVFDVATWLDIPQRYVIAFYNAAHTLSLFTVEQIKPQLQEKAAPKKNRGLFSRLLKRLLGGGAK